MIKINLSQTIGKILPEKLNTHLQPVLQGVDGILSGSDENAKSQRIALLTFSIRVASAFIAFFSQILLARWLGGFEYGIFVAVWLAASILGTLVCIGFPSAVVRFVGQYRETGETGLMWGVINASMYISLLTSIIFAAIGSYILFTYPQIITEYYVIPIFIAAICLPILATESLMDCLARAFNWPYIAFLPTYILKPLVILVGVGLALIAGFPANAQTTMLAALVATFVSALIHFVLLFRKLRKEIPKTKPKYQIKYWVIIAMPIFLVEGFYNLMTSVDIFLVSTLMGPEDAAVYFASTKILALVHFVYFAVRASVSHRYAGLHTKGDQHEFQTFLQKTVTWTFWPSLVFAMFMALSGKYFLILFGPEFVSGASLLWALAIGIVIRASIGPAEALLVMADRQKACAFIYAITLGVNVVLNLSLIPVYGLLGAAIATSFALAFESLALHAVVKRTLGLHAFIIPQKEPRKEELA